jgi:hypothetical protein
VASISFSDAPDGRRNFSGAFARNQASIRDQASATLIGVVGISERLAG